MLVKVVTPQINGGFGVNSIGKAGVLTAEIHCGYTETVLSGGGGSRGSK